MSPLASKLEQVLGGIQNEALSAKLRAVFEAIAKAVESLSEMNLVEYESSALEESTERSLWEQMAPVIRDTVVEVNTAMMAMRSQFPPQPSGGIADTLARAVEASGGDDPEEIIQKGLRELSDGVTQFGEAMRDPAVFSDRWELLGTLQRFRQSFRDQLGAVVLGCAEIFADVSAREVVPGYDQEVAAAVLVRAAVTDLRRVVASRLEQIRTAEAEDLEWQVRQFQKELGAFSKTRAYQHLRAQDKRLFLDFNERLGTLSTPAASDPKELLAATQEFSGVVDSLRRVNDRQIVMAHDREILAACGVRIERAHALLPTDLRAAANVLAEALTLANQLYGRDGELDAFLRRVRKTPTHTLNASDVTTILETLRRLFASFPLS